MKRTRIILYLISLVTGVFAAYLSLQTDVKYNSQESSSENYGVGAGVSVDSGKDGGAAGFAILSGLALLASAITYLKNETK